GDSHADGRRRDLRAADLHCADAAGHPDDLLPVRPRRRAPVPVEGGI
ncbi:uncharacterized protein METZ01_LOCUS404121, partial [marine metagenome]